MRNDRAPKFLNMDFAEMRTITKIVSLYYQKGLSQAEIAKQLSLSTSKVNRLFNYAHQHGIVEIKIHTPFQLTLEMENRLKAIFGIGEVIVVPAVLEDFDSLIEAVGSVAAQYLETHIRDGDIIVAGGGMTMLGMIRQLDPERTFDVSIYPLEGGLQGNIVTDVNYVVSEMAHKFGGKAQALHAPAFASSAEERNMLMNVADVERVLGLAREANIAVFGLGHCDTDSRFAMFTGLSNEDMRCIRQDYGGVGEIVSRVFDIHGQPTALEYAERVVGLTLQEIKNIPLSLCVAATPDKALPIYAALLGGYIDVLVTDELAAQAVLDRFDRDFRGGRLEGKE
jgi:DNA-binding transcriptional regulator LsrR (DeoR family)